MNDAGLVSGIPEVDTDGSQGCHFQRLHAIFS